MEVEDLEIIKLEPKHIEQVFQYQIEEFCPDEPLFQTFKFFEGDGYFDKLMAKDIKKLLTEDPIKSGDSFGAFDKEGNLLGIRLGKIAVKGNLPRYHLGFFSHKTEYVSNIFSGNQSLVGC